MISRTLGFGQRSWLLVLGVVFVGLLPKSAVALCTELSRAQTSDEDTFFVACKNTFSGPAYQVTEYYAGSERNSFVYYRHGRYGFMCSVGSSGEDCQTLPRGGLEFGDFKLKSGLDGVRERLADASESYKDKSVTYSYPRSLRGAKSQGCYLRVYEDDKVVFGFDKDRLAASSFCLVAFERYLAKNKKMLLK
jgi:hypothetical protein